MGSNPVQRWGFVLLLVITFSFSISIILSAVASDPKISAFKNPSPLPLVRIAGHHAILLSPQLRAIHSHIFDPSSIREIAVLNPKVVAFHPEKVHNTQGIASYAVGEFDREARNKELSTPTVSLPIAFLLVVSASPLLGAKVKRFVKRRRVQSLEAFAKDLDAHDLAFDITYTRVSKNKHYGSFVSTQPGDFEKFDI